MARIGLVVIIYCAALTMAVPRNVAWEVDSLVRRAQGCDKNYKQKLDGLERAGKLIGQERKGLREVASADVHDDSRKQSPSTNGRPNSSNSRSSSTTSTSKSPTNGSSRKQQKRNEADPVLAVLESPVDRADEVEAIADHDSAGHVPSDAPDSRLMEKRRESSSTSQSQGTNGKRPTGTRPNSVNPQASKDYNKDLGKLLGTYDEAVALREKNQKLNGNNQNKQFLDKYAQGQKGAKPLLQSLDSQGDSRTIAQLNQKFKTAQTNNEAAIQNFKTTDQKCKRDLDQVKWLQDNMPEIVSGRGAELASAVGS